MQFRPCIDIHNGKVKQIVGASLRDQGDSAAENFVADCPSSYYASIYRENALSGGHVIMLNSKDSEFYEATKKQALLALQTYPGGMQAGGGITDENAEEFLKAGASHVIVTSFVFNDGRLQEENLRKIQNAVGKERLVLDLSCRRKDGKLYIVTDRWQKFTDIEVTVELLEELSAECDEYLIHAVDVEGKSAGIDSEVVKLLSKVSSIPVTYAGGVRSVEDLKRIRDIGEERVNATVGSALKLFGGTLEIDEIRNGLEH
ncbi:1-(5-phosphoribosyl)-5-[(5-phosphoribosylamino)methylideneamino] imidazole-4-carboxamide isomerase [Lachnospiraceae bacterium KH1T2]|nr:1-(5-phosphoribosyl)-5-[(5-phosphoribosylamino)methylideneamino] imidazole-4-carboxamide isomerase [Lachnospiraceae bacterium KH1T2]